MMKLHKYLSASLIAGCLALTGTACSDKFDELENNQPSWLGENVYDYLKGRGDCNYYTRLIDDCGMREIMQRTGSNTLFFTRDEAFDAYFAENLRKGEGPTCYEEMSPTLKQMFISMGRISNAQLIERLCHGDIQGTVLRRSTYFGATDTIPRVKKSDLLQIFEGNPYFEALESDTLRLLQDASTTTLTQFFPDVMRSLGITEEDIEFISNGEVSMQNAALYNNKIIRQDITCKNGYLHELENLILPPESMAGYINKTDEVSTFRKLMNRFAIPLVYQNATAETPAVYTLRYFNEHPENRSNRTQNMYGALVVDDKNTDKSNACLYFDPAWNAYQSGARNANSTEAPYQGDMGVMFVPTNEALDEYFNLSGEGADLVKSFGSWENVPDNIVADFVKNHQKYSFLSSLPHDFDIMKDEAGYEMNISKSDITDKYVARNGVVYVVNKVLPPLDYRSVMGPAKIDLKNRIFNIALNDNHTQFMYYLRSLLSCYQFFITPDASMNYYVDPVSMGKTSDQHAYWRFFLTPSNEIHAAIYNLHTGDSIGVQTTASVIKNRLNDIMRTHTLVVESNEAFAAAVADGQEYFVTMGYMPLRVTASSVKGAGNDNSTPVNIVEVSEKSNGNSYIVDGLLQNTTTSTYENLNQSSNTNVMNDKSAFYEFLQLCNACGIFSSSATSSVIPLAPYITFLQQYDYTLYVPTNELIREAKEKHYIPSAEELQDLYEQSGNGVETHIDSLYQIAVNKLRRFIRYHIQDNSVFIKGKKENNVEYLTETIDNDTKLFYPVFVTNTGHSITVRDNMGNEAHVSTDEGLHNLTGRDIRVNNTGSSSSPNLAAATTIESYSCTVVHQIDNILWYETPSSQWHTDLYEDLEKYLSEN